MQLTKEELQTLINVVSVANVPVNQAPILINLINKMSKMLDEYNKQPAKVDNIMEETPRNS